jgi:hypothetical protein
VDEDGHLVVRASLQEFGFGLLTLVDVDREDAVLQSRLLEHDRDSIAVRRGPVMQIDPDATSERVIFQQGIGRE